jgi:hypothetical protein
LKSWLDSLGLSQYADVFAENAIDREVLPDLTDAELKELGILLGHRKKLLKAIAELGGKRAAVTGAARRSRKRARRPRWMALDPKPPRATTFRSRANAASSPCCSATWWGLPNWLAAALERSRTRGAPRPNPAQDAPAAVATLG